MAIPKAKTQLERMGFLDQDLKTPAHDEMILWFIDRLKRKNKDIVYTLEKPVARNGFIIGYIDVFVERPGKAFEIKTKIDNVGDLLRQINTYRYHLHANLYDYDWYVICPDDRFEDLLKSQDIGFIKYPF